MWTDDPTWEMWRPICSVTIFSVLSRNTFCCHLRCFVAKSILWQNLFCRNLRAFTWRKITPKIGWVIQASWEMIDDVRRHPKGWSLRIAVSHIHRGGLYIGKVHLCIECVASFVSLFLECMIDRILQRILDSLYSMQHYVFHILWGIQGMLLGIRRITFSTRKVWFNWFETASHEHQANYIIAISRCLQPRSQGQEGPLFINVHIYLFLNLHLS